MYLIMLEICRKNSDSSISHNGFTVYEPAKQVAEGQAAVGGEAKTAVIDEVVRPLRSLASPDSSVSGGRSSPGN